VGAGAVAVREGAGMAVAAGRGEATGAAV
jgi:hypothetical protein